MPLPELNISEAFGINDSGVLVGESYTPDLQLHAFRTAPNSVIKPATDDLGVLDNTVPVPRSGARGVNNAGQVAGLSTVGNKERAFLHTGGVMYHLTKLIPAGSGWELGTAYAINDAGQIVGVGDHNGARHAFRLDPGQLYSPAIQ